MTSASGPAFSAYLDGRPFLPPEPERKGDGLLMWVLSRPFFCLAVVAGWVLGCTAFALYARHNPEDMP